MGKSKKQKAKASAAEHAKPVAAVLPESPAWEPPPLESVVPVPDVPVIGPRSTSRMGALIHAWRDRDCPLIAMLHAPPLPGSPGYRGDLRQVYNHVLQDAEVLVENGVDGLLLENFGDAPFFPRNVPEHVVAHMTALASEIKRRFRVPLGINILRNDAVAAMAVAHAVGAEFIRVNVLVGATLTDQGLVQGVAHQLLRQRAILGANDVKILADVDVKHAMPLASRPIAEEARDAVRRGGADGLIVSGASTGEPTDLEVLQEVKNAVKKTPVLIGSGITGKSVADAARVADGLIVGSWLKMDGVVTNPIDPERIAKLVKRLK